LEKGPSVETHKKTGESRGPWSIPGGGKAKVKLLKGKRGGEKIGTVENFGAHFVRSKKRLLKINRLQTGTSQLKGERRTKERIMI